jgi:hypothetical protein
LQDKEDLFKDSSLCKIRADGSKELNLTTDNVDEVVMLRKQLELKVKREEDRLEIEDDVSLLR